MIAAYLAFGFARPTLRHFHSNPWLGSGFESSDADYFNAWPIRILIFLLVVNLVVVTWRRIPLTPPNYGAWAVNVGFIALLCAAELYFAFRVQGSVRLYANPNVGPATVDHFYDDQQRSLYIRSEGRLVEIPLPTLPRWREYDPQQGGALVKLGLTGIRPLLDRADPVNGTRHPDSSLSFDVIGYYPCAATSTDFITDPASQQVGIKLAMQVAGQPPENWWLVASDPRFHTDNTHAGMDLVHVDGDATMIPILTDAAAKLFQLQVSVGPQPPVSLDVQVGKSYPVPGTGYTLKVESFIPDFPMSTGERVDDLQLLVTSTPRTFRRQILQGKPVQTDFDLSDPADGPMGRRQKTPLDPNLHIDFQVHDPFGLLPSQNSVKHTLLTPAGSHELIDVVAGVGAIGSSVNRFADGTEEIEVEPAANPIDGIPAGGGAPVQPTAKVHINRQDHIRPVDAVRVVPQALRTDAAEENGDMQLVQVRVSSGDWSATVLAPFAEDAGDELARDHWRGGYIRPPGAVNPLQLQLGKTRRPLPVRLTLAQLKIGSDTGSGDPTAALEDCRSTLLLSNTDGDSDPETASIDHPVYFNAGRWVFTQQSCDQVAQQWTRIGVATRPAFGMIIAGGVVILAGLVYAVIVKLNRRARARP